MIGSPPDLSSELSSHVSSSLGIEVRSAWGVDVVALVRDGYTGFASLEPHFALGTNSAASPGPPGSDGPPGRSEPPPMQQELN